ncbi:WD40/YVTN/BNR-like repeat-containing protein [Fimbriimonas ginsengisoli]|uniref:Glycosyl hydrolase, BNR repeat-containing protein n=1 Tax=Fimbriimonas ginsengisoli Gsoil 348 TaxID=661478 RepID=A0A068NLK8_FIMGI|nr:glycoside hydrolase [Fimbriimonas ginsengisoli]AIE84448.1 glycosyl hydrolase, BNR repeat-containing protein [Fimbriimonas ginsengisoli Gsoil 348]
MASLLLAALLIGTSPAAPVDPGYYSALRWRMIGPFRGGRTVGATGVPGQPHTFYIGVNNGGVWKTDDAGRTWEPIFDKESSGSIGALAVAPTDPNVLYVGSGEGLQRPDLSVGNGMYRSGDAGKTWQHLGLRDGQQITGILVDPRDPNRLLVSVLGHPYGPNEERGVYRSTDGGQSWTKTLYKDTDTGAMTVVADPKNPDVVYADLFAQRLAPWENGMWRGTTSGLYKSTDNGIHWRPLTQGLPTNKEGLGRIGLAPAPSEPTRLYAIVDAPQLGGLYRSDDRGESWKRINPDRRIWGRGDDFAEVRVDPMNPDVVYVANTASYKSIDGGKTFIGWKGSPGGDDYHTIWINPENPKIMLLAADQGASVTLNGGDTWSSWYNQPTAQFYHVATDFRYPYWVYGGQQESGSAGVASRGNAGRITFHDWHPVGADEYAYIAPDPLNPGIIYGGKGTRYDESTGQTQEVGPEAVRSGKYRALRTSPLIFSTVDKHALYLATNVLFKTRDGGNSWKIVSPDLSRENPMLPTDALFGKPGRRGVIYAVSPSYQEADTIWAGTDDGLVWRTADGGAHWSNVTPPGLTPWSKIAQIDAGRHDRSTAYVSVNRIRLDDMRPHIYVTHDNGRTWSEGTSGIPADEPVNVVREDPVRRGLLYAGTERAVYVSIDDGVSWSPLRQNMPATSIRDLVVKDDDLVVGTHGRSFWILDDVTPLRQLDLRHLSGELTSRDTVLYVPQVATRVRWNMNSDTPLPPEEPGGENPPDGAIINFHLARDCDKTTLEIFDDKGRLVRRYASDDPAPPVDPRGLDIDPDWIRPFEPLPRTAGSHRFLWNMRYGPLPGGRYTMAAVLGDTPVEAPGPWARPGKYTVRLTANGQTQTVPLVLRIDPRVKTSRAGLERQFAIGYGSYDLARRLRAKGGDAANRLAGELLGLMRLADDADVAPTTQVEAAFADAKKRAEAILSQA